MHVVYATEEAPEVVTKSIFLAGPSPRHPNHPDWRTDALGILEELCFDGTVFVPLPRDGQWNHSYDHQIGWETAHLNMADFIIFWIPRDLKKLPAFTTNVEWGMWFDSGKAVLGYPQDAPKMDYLAYHARKQHVPIHYSMEDTIKDTLDRLGNGARRVGGEREIPFHIWNLRHFQEWYGKHKHAGNRIDGARVLWSFRTGPAKRFVFAYALHVNVYIAAEKRNKINEFIISRPDIATIVAYRLHDKFADTEIALIKEFRSPARTDDGYIREVPGGSSWKPGVDPFETMAHELEEETGLAITEKSRIRRIGSRQLNGTLSAHVAHAFAIELTDEELEFLRQQQQEHIVHGVEADTERTYVEIHRLSDLIEGNSNAVDWSMLGMILTALHTEEVHPWRM